MPAKPPLREKRGIQPKRVFESTSELTRAGKINVGVVASSRPPRQEDGGEVGDVAVEDGGEWARTRVPIVANGLR